MQLEIRLIRQKNRLREDLGDLSGLAESIREHGLIHPIVVDETNILIAGARRLAACKEVGLKRVEIRRLGELSEKERRCLELEENLHRKDLTPYERSKFTAEIAETAKEIAKEEAQLIPESGNKSRGRPAKAGGLKQASERTGIPLQTIHDAETHVAAAERYSFLQGADWNQSAALRTAKVLDELPANDRKKIRALVEDGGPPAREAARMIESFSRADPEVREKVYVLARNGDERDRSAALTYLAKNAPEPDPRAVWLDGVAREGKREAKRYKDDPMNERLERFAEAAKKLADTIQEEHLKRLERSLK